MNSGFFFTKSIIKNLPYQNSWIQHNKGRITSDFSLSLYVPSSLLITKNAEDSASEETVNKYSKKYFRRQW